MLENVALLRNCLSRLDLRIVAEFATILFQCICIRLLSVCRETRRLAAVRNLHAVMCALYAERVSSEFALVKIACLMYICTYRLTLLHLFLLAVYTLKRVITIYVNKLPVAISSRYQ
jgi:hypothetical protein